MKIKKFSCMLCRMKTGEDEYYQNFLGLVLFFSRMDYSESLVANCLCFQILWKREIEISVP